MTSRWVVVGAGTAGCVVAARLADVGHEVVLVEAGPGTTAETSRGASFFDAVASPDRVFPGEFRRGRGVGGSSAVNAMIATAGDGSQYRSWGWDDAAAAFARVKVPSAPAADDELGPIDRALLAAAPDAQRPPLTRHGGRRVTAYDAYLAARGDVDVRSDCDVSAIALDGTRAVGVEVAEGPAIEADAVVVSAGAIGSPLVLAATGVGGPEVGRHLRNHVALPIDLQLRHRVGGDPHGLVAATLLRREDLQLLAVNHLGPDQPDRGGFLVVTMAPSGEGRVVAAEPYPVVEMVVTDEDRERLADGVAIVQGLLTDHAFRSIVDGVHVGQAPAGVYHPTSTCRMGDVVDADGAVIDTTGLYVIDASVFPDLPAANTYLPTLMLAERMVGRAIARHAVVSMAP